MRREFTTATKVAAYKRADNHCERCGAVLTTGKYHFDHNNPDGLTGEPTLENCVVLCLPCHADKTRSDVANIAKAKRREARHLGAESPSSRPVPGSRNTNWKRKLSGETVRRT